MGSVLCVPDPKQNKKRVRTVIRIESKEQTRSEHQYQLIVHANLFQLTVPTTKGIISNTSHSFFYFLRADNTYTKLVDR
jgi:ribosomal protein S10